MAFLTRQIFFAAPLEKVWGIWTDVEKTPEWVDGVHQVKISSPIREGLGLAWCDERSLSGIPIEVHHEYVEFNPHQKTRMMSKLPMSATMETVAEFCVVKDRLPQQTEVNVRIEWSLGVLGVMISDEKFQAMAEKNLDQTLLNWKKRLEGELI